jgi:hypothetical protein
MEQKYEKYNLPQDVRDGLTEDQLALWRSVIKQLVDIRNREDGWEGTAKELGLAKIERALAENEQGSRGTNGDLSWHLLADDEKKLKEVKEVLEDLNGQLATTQSAFCQWVGEVIRDLGVAIEKIVAVKQSEQRGQEGTARGDQDVEAGVGGCA